MAHLHLRLVDLQWSTYSVFRGWLMKQGPNVIPTVKAALYCESVDS